MVYPYPSGLNLAEKSPILTRQVQGIHYMSAGQGAPVLLVHGVAASLYDWAALLPELSNGGFQVYAPDLPGHGSSLKPGEPQAYHIESIYAQMESWLDELDLTEPLLWVGHSLGGYLGLQYSLHHPDKVAGLVLIDPLYSLAQISPLLLRFSYHTDVGEKLLHWVPEWMLNLVMGLDPVNRRRFSQQARQQIAADYKRASPYILRIPTSIADLRPSLGQVTPPALVIWGERDLTLSPGSFPALVQALPNAKGARLPGCGHQPHIGRPEWVNRLVIDFCQFQGVDRRATWI